MSQAESLSEAVLPFPAKQVQDVLAHPEIKALATRFPDHTKQLRSAIEGLSNEGPVETEILVQATKKAFDAITGKLRIFLSYKRVQHADVAGLLRKSLQGLGGTKIDVFLDEMKIESGQDWFNSIRKGLKGANCLVLLVPDDSDEREWPIFEAAFFAGRMLPGERLICLHHPAVHIPRQLAAFQGDQADPAGVEKLLRRLLVQPDLVPGLDAINPDCEPFLEDHARKVAEKFSGPVRLRSRATTNFAKLQLGTPGQFKGQDDLLSARVVAARGLSEMFFYTGECPCELRKVLGIDDGSLGRHDVWLTELTECVREEVAHRRAEVPFAKFSTPDGRQVFRPVLGRVEEDEAGAVHTLEIGFGEHLTGIDDDPDDLQVLEAVLRLTSRFRGEILSKLSRPRRPEDVERVERILKRIEREAQDEGFRDRDMLAMLFAPADRPAIHRMYEDWENFRNAGGTGKLDRAFAKKDPASLRDALKEIHKINRDFTVLAVKRYAEMLSEEFG